MGKISPPPLRRTLSGNEGATKRFEPRLPLGKGIPHKGCAGLAKQVGRACDLLVPGGSVKEEPRLKEGPKDGREPTVLGGLAFLAYGIFPQDLQRLFPFALEEQSFGPDPGAQRKSGVKLRAPKEPFPALEERI